MSTVKHAISEHDAVVLRNAVGAWPSGTACTVISVYGEVVLVEITDTGGRTLEEVQVPVSQLEVKRS
jgi:hypothetical protein